MAALQARRARLLASLYGTFGEPADWTPAGGAATRVVVRRKGDDAPFSFGQAEGLAPRNFVRVRASDVAVPAEGDQVTILDPDTLEVAETFTVMADPQRVKHGAEWLCEIAEVRTF